MHCKEIQIDISSGQPLAPSVLKHLDECDECRGYAAFGASAVDQLSDRQPDPSPDLREKIRKSVAHQPKPVLLRLGYLTGCATVTAFVFVSMGGSRAEAEYKQMMTRLAKVQTAHMVVSWRPGQGNVEDGAMRKSYELWWKPGAWRQKWFDGSAHDGLQLATPGGLRMYRYDSGLKRVESYEEQNLHAAEFSLEMVAHEYMDTPASVNEYTLNSTSKMIVATNKGGWSRINFTIDLATNLPVKAEKEYKTNGTWKTSGHIDFELNGQIPPQMFEPKDLEPKP